MCYNYTVMTSPEPTPRLLELLFGENAGLAYSSASEQMLRWAKAFEEWLTHRQQNYHKSYGLRAVYAWKKALGYLRKPPWQFTSKDMRDLRGHMEANRYAGMTIRHYLSDIESFYDWCLEREAWFQYELAPSGKPFSNPVRGVKPKFKYINKVLALSAEEARALLDVARQDRSILGRRDYAFFVCRTLLGVNLKSLLGLTWGQLAFKPEGVLVDWRHRRFRPQRLPPAAWEAIEDYLRHSGRLEGIHAGDFIFAPLADALRRQASGEAEDWNPNRHVYYGQLAEMMKKYGRYAEIPAPKLTLRALRYTAIMLRQDAGDEPSKIQEFLMHQSIEATRKTLIRLGERDDNELETQIVEDTPAADPPKEEARSNPPISSLREGHRFHPWEGMTHGLYAKIQPPEEVAAILAEGITGLEQEIEGLRYLCALLLQAQGKAKPVQEQLQLSETLARTAGYLSVLRKAERTLAKPQENNSILRALEKIYLEVMKEEGQDIQALEDEMKQDQAGGENAEVIASLRLVLRRTLDLLTEISDNKELISLANAYGNASVKLARLLTEQAGDKGENENIQRELDEISKRVLEERKRKARMGELG